MKPLSAKEIQVLRLYVASSSYEQIAKATGFTIDQVNGIVVGRAAMNRQRAAELVRAYTIETNNAVIAQAPTVVVKSAAAELSTLDGLLAAAEAHPLTRIRAIAVKVRAQLDVIRQQLVDDEQQQRHGAARARLAELEAEAATLRAELKASRPRAVHRTDGAVIRAWAAGAGVECAMRGVIPGPVREAYHAAHPDAPH